MRGLATLVGMLAIGLFAQPAAACNCPKEQLILQNGSVSMLGGLAKPRPGPLRPMDAVPPGPVLDLPWLLPISEKPRFGAGLGPAGFDPFALALPEL